MTQLEGIFLWSSVFMLAFAFVGHLGGIIFKRNKPLSVSHVMAVAGFVLLTGAVAARWISTGHMPVMGTYENSLFGAWFVVLGLMVLVKYFPRGRFLSLIIIPAVILILGNGIMARAELAPLEPPYQSTWLYVHVLFAWLAFGSYLLAAAVAALFLLKERAEEGQRGGVVNELLPRSQKLDEICLRLIIYGFITDAVMIGSGAIWAHGLWGRYWGWDPIETWSLIAWLTYGINLHLRFTLGWKGRKAAWLAMFSFLSMVVAFFGIGFVGDVHTQIMKP